jgi:hypothetical protein
MGNGLISQMIAKPNVKIPGIFDFLAWAEQKKVNVPGRPRLMRTGEVHTNYSLPAANPP